VAYGLASLPIDARLFAQLPLPHGSGSMIHRAHTEIIGRKGMSRISRVDFACRFAVATSALVLGLAVTTSGISTRALAEDLTPAKITAATSAVDSAMIKANTATSRDWPTIGLDYAETRFSKLNQINADNVKGLGLVWSYSLDSERGIEA